MSEPAETYNHDVLECPYCHYKHKDMWETSGNCGIVTCEGCDTDFKWARDTIVSYTGNPITAEQ